ncbi:MAG: AAA family ATPase, partial [Myxococcales bacterium]|nr:AAA family ATPase [Myxococcales bacterium]
MTTDASDDYHRGMAKRRTEFSCSECGYQTPRWLGRCPECRAWNSFEERNESVGRSGPSGLEALAAPQPMALDAIDLADVARRQSGIPELDRVLGGGLVPGSVVLLGGDPGIGKSTLILQALGALAERESAPLLYVSGEESLGQLRLRAERLGIGGSRIFLLAETTWERIAAALDKLNPSLLVLDSVQTLVCESVASAAGSVSQLRSLTNEVVRYAKSHGLPTVLIGHVTKEGMLAGPRTLEHMVDTVLYIEGQRGQPYR